MCFYWLVYFWYRNGITETWPIDQFEFAEKVSKFNKELNEREEIVNFCQEVKVFKVIENSMVSIYKIYYNN